MVSFELTGELEGKTTTINDRYAFVDGTLTVDDDTASKLEPILCAYYACEKVVEVPAPPVDGDGSPADASLKVGATKSEKK